MRSILVVAAVVFVSLALPSTATVGSACLALEPLATIVVGAGPREIVADGRRQRVYVANSGDETLSMIDASSLSMIATWPLNGPVRTMALNPTTGALYVAYDAGVGLTEVWVIDSETGRHVLGLSFPWSVQAMAVNENLQRVYLAGQWVSPNAIQFDRLSVIDGEVEGEMQTAHATGEAGALTSYSGIAIDEVTGAVYAAHHHKYNEQSYIRIFDQDLRSINGSIRLGSSASSPELVMIDSGRRRAMITIADGVLSVDIGAETVPQAIAVDSSRSSPTALNFAIAATGRPVVGLDGVAGVAYAVPLKRMGSSPIALLAFDVSARRLLAEAPLGDGALHRLAVDSLAHRVFVTSEGEATVTVLRGFNTPESPAC